MFVKTSSGHIFGGYNPQSWVSDFTYMESDQAYLFSVSDGKDRRPIRCPIKKSKTHLAIKQNDSKYSPGFGEANSSDLFIAFKNLANSYSNLGNVYKSPVQEERKSFLAGAEKNWQIEEIEVW